ncbi:protein FAM107B [Mobula birostris]|uniref:protein FAM107B n=1 Tax=Mobula birostris TaxID=1983395 RepID=UPI003B28C994
MLPALGPVKAAWTHQDLHRELRLAHRRGLASKTELQKVLEQREQRRAQDEPLGHSPLQREFLRRQQKKEELLRLELAARAAAEGAPEFVQVKERLRRTQEPPSPEFESLEHKHSAPA